MSALIFADDRPTSCDDDLYQWAMDAEALIRNLHTENTALRVTEDNLRQELQECQAQRRAAFRRIEELEALRAQIGQGVPDGWQLVPKEPVYLVKSSTGASVWVQVSQAEYEEAVSFGVVKRVLYTHHVQQAAKPQPLAWFDNSGKLHGRVSAEQLEQLCREGIVQMQAAQSNGERDEQRTNRSTEIGYTPTRDGKHGGKRAC